MRDESRKGARVGIRIPVGRTHALWVIDRPGRRLDADACAGLLADLRDVADRCVPGAGLRYGVLSGDHERLDAAVVAVAYARSTGRPVGFSAMSWMDVALGRRTRRVLHAGLSMVVPGERRAGLCALLTAAPACLAFVRRGMAPLWVTNVTQVPAVAGLFTRAAGDVFPAPGMASPPSTTHVRIAREVAARHRHVFGVGPEAEWDESRFVIRNAYTGGSDPLSKGLEEAPRHRDPAFARMCRELLDYERGDDLLQVGRLDVGVVGRLMVGVLGRVLGRLLRPRPVALPPRPEPVR